MGIFTRGHLGILSGTSDSLPVVMQAPYPIEQIMSCFAYDAIGALTSDHGVLSTNQFKMKKCEIGGVQEVRFCLSDAHWNHYLKPPSSLWA